MPLFLTFLRHLAEEGIAVKLILNGTWASVSIRRIQVQVVLDSVSSRSIQILLDRLSAVLLSLKPVRHTLPAASLGVNPVFD